MRRLLMTAGVAAATVAAATVALGTGACLADSDVKFPKKSDVQKAVKKLVGGEITYQDTRDREEQLNLIDKHLVKDRDSVALRSPAFWVDAIQTAYFSSRKSGTTKTIKEEKLAFAYLDGSAGETTYMARGAASYRSAVPATLLVTLLPKDTDPKAWLEANWDANEIAQKNWILAAVTLSDKDPVEQQPNVLPYLFDAVRLTFNCDGNRWFLEAVGDACGAAQKVASESMPDRLAGLILRNPKAAAISVNASLFPVVVVHDADDDPVAAQVKELAPERNVAIKSGEGAAAAIAEWVEASAGRTLPSSYSWVTATTEERIVSPMTGSVWLASPAKRGDPIEMKVTFDKEANTATLEGTNLGEFWLYMNDDLLDLGRPVQVICNGEVLVEKTFERSLKSIFDTADEFGEYGRVFTAVYQGFAPSKAVEEAAADDGEKKDGE